MMLKTSWLSAILLALTCVTTTQAEVIHSPEGWSGNWVTGQHRISSWRDGYAGRSWMSWEGDQNNIYWLWITLRQDSGGFDGGVGKNVILGKRVDSIWINQGLQYKSQISVTGNGVWWLGAKTIITKTESYVNLQDDAFECYIVDNASLTPSQMVDHFDLTYVSQGTFSGSVYKHYTTQYGDIDQIWSIRQNYRQSGQTVWTAIGWIRHDWLTLGMVPGDWYNLGWKVNVETAGQIDGYFGFSNFYLPSN